MEDEEIIGLYFARIERAIEETRTKYGRMCRSIAYGILKSLEDAEECESDTYLRAWDTMPPTRPAVLPAYLGKLTRNLSLDRYDYLHAEKRGGGEIPVLLDELAECVPDSGGLDALDDTALKDALNGFLEALPPEGRKIFLRRYWFGDSVAEIARRYGFTASKVKMSLLRSRQRLESALEKEGISL